MLGQTGQGLDRLTEMAALVDVTNDRWNDADMHRLRGDLLAAAGDPLAGEQAHRHALDVARNQTARMPELRAATSLARLLRDQNRSAEARDLLTPVVGWFTEGFDTPALAPQIPRALPRRSAGKPDTAPASVASKGERAAGRSSSTVVVIAGSPHHAITFGVIWIPVHTGIA